MRRKELVIGRAVITTSTASSMVSPDAVTARIPEVSLNAATLRKRTITCSRITAIAATVNESSGSLDKNCLYVRKPCGERLRLVDMNRTKHKPNVAARHSEQCHQRRTMYAPWKKLLSSDQQRCHVAPSLWRDNGDGSAGWRRCRKARGDELLIDEPVQLVVVVV